MRADLSLFLLAAAFISACAPPSTQREAPARAVAVRGFVFDSLTLAPLRGARITIFAQDTILVTTDTAGTFAATLQSGSWRAAISHPRFDSLRIVLPLIALEVPPRVAAALELSTPPGRALYRMLCTDTARRDDAALVGVVRNAATNSGVASANVSVKWINLTLRGGRFVQSTETRVARTDRDGWYVSCGIPANGTVLSWAEFGNRTAGPVPVSLEGASSRLDLHLDLDAQPARGSIDLEPDSSGTSMFPTARGSARYRVVVRDRGGQPVSSARVRIMGQRTLRTDAAGVVTLDSVARGTQTVEVRAVGYQPERRVVNIGPLREPTDTFVLASLRTQLDTIHVIAGRDPAGFERRRSGSVGQFITAAEIERDNPARTTQLFKGRDGLRYTHDRNGFPFIEVTTQITSCKPVILIDGFPAPTVPVGPGDAAMDWLIHPDEIGGVEIYTASARIPPELARWGRACATIAFWTRRSLGLPRSSTLQP